MLVFLFFTSLIHADIKGKNDLIKFDRQSDGIAEMSLNSIGLAIGNFQAQANLHIGGNVLITAGLCIGTISNASNLSIDGTIGYSLIQLSGDTTLNDHSMVMCDTSSDNVVLNLPYAGNVNGRIFKIKKTSPRNHLWITGGGNLIDHQAVLELSGSSNTQVAIELISNGTLSRKQIKTSSPWLPIIW